MSLLNSTAGQASSGQFMRQASESLFFGSFSSSASTLRYLVFDDFGPPARMHTTYVAGSIPFQSGSHLVNIYRILDLDLDFGSCRLTPNMLRSFHCSLAYLEPGTLTLHQKNQVWALHIRMGRIHMSKSWYFKER